MASSLPQDIKFITSALRTSGTGSGNLRRRTFPGAILTATSLDTRLNLVAYISLLYECECRVGNAAAHHHRSKLHTLIRSRLLY